MDERTATFDQLWDYSNPARSETLFREYEATLTGPETADLRLQLLTQIARAQGLQRHFEAAHQTLDQVERQLDDASATTRVRYLLERGRVFNSSGNPTAARPFFEAAWNQGCQAGLDAYAVDAAHMMAIVSDTELAIAWNRQALAHAEAATDPKARNWLGSLYNNLGWTYHDRGEYSTALDLFEKALEFRQSQQAIGPIRVARWCVARTLRSLGRTSEALEQQLELEKEHAAASSRDGYVWEEIGECLLALGRAEEARPWFSKSHTELASDPWLVQNEAARLTRLKDLAG